MRAFLQLRFVLLAAFFVACDQGNSPNGPDYAVRPAARMAEPDTTAPEVIISDDTPEGAVRMDGTGRLHVGIKVFDAGGIKLRYATPCTLKAQCADGSLKTSPRGLSPVSEESDTLWFYGYWDACPANTGGSPRTVVLAAPTTDLAGNVGADSRTLVQPVYVPPPPDSEEQSPTAVLASYMLTSEQPAAVEKVVSTPVAETREARSSAVIPTFVEAGGAGSGSTGTSAVVSGQQKGIHLTNEFMFVWGYLTLDRAPAPIGTTVEAIASDGRLVVGRTTVSHEGAYGAMAVYKDDPFTPEVDGAHPGETITLRVNGMSVDSTFKWMSFGDVQQVDISAVTPHTGPSPGSLDIMLAPDLAQPPRRRIVDASTYSEDMFKFRLTPSGEDAAVTRFVVTHMVTFPPGSDASAARSTLFNYQLWSGSMQVGPTIVAATVLAQSNAEITEYMDFNLGAAGAWRLPEAEQTEFTVKCRVNDWPHALSGSVHRFALVSDPLGDGTPAVAARGLESGALLGGPNKEIGSNAVVIRRWHPVVERMPLPTATLPGGASSQVVGAHWRLAARGDWGGLQINTHHKKITFRISWSDDTPSTQLTLDNFKLYRRLTGGGDSGFGLLDLSKYAIYDGRGTSEEHLLSSGGAAALNLDAFPQSYADIVLVFGDRTRDDLAGQESVYEMNIPEYQLRFDVANAHIGTSSDVDWISVTMLGDDIGVTNGRLEPHPTGVVTIGSGNANFIWSDYSAEPGAHSSAVPGSSSDWTNGFLVPGLPTDPWVLTK